MCGNLEHGAGLPIGVYYARSADFGQPEQVAMSRWALGLLMVLSASAAGCGPPSAVDSARPGASTESARPSVAAASAPTPSATPASDPAAAGGGTPLEP